MASESGERLPEELDYQFREPSQTEVLSVWEEEVLCCEKEPDNTNLIVSIPQSNDYTALHNSYFVITCKVTKPAGVACDHGAAETKDKVCIVNNLAQSLWSNVQIAINGTQVEDVDDLHPYRAYFQMLFNHQAFSLAKRKTLLGWSKDTADKFTKNKKGDGNDGMDARTTPFENSASVTLIGQLSTDLTTQKLYLPPHWTISISLKRAPNNFVLIAPSDTNAYELHITRLRFFVQRVEVSPELTLAHKMLFASLPNNILRIPSRRITTHRHVVQTGVTATALSLFSNCVLPDRLIVVFVSKTAAKGSYTENPFNFLHQNISKIWLEINSKKLPAKEYEPDFSHPSGYIREYYDALRSFGAHTGNTTLDLSDFDYSHGYTFFSFCLVPRREHGALLGPPQIGAASLHLEFAKASEDVFEAIVLAETRSEFIIKNALKAVTSV